MSLTNSSISSPLVTLELVSNSDIVLYVENVNSVGRLNVTFEVYSGVLGNADRLLYRKLIDTDDSVVTYSLNCNLFYDVDDIFIVCDAKAYINEIFDIVSMSELCESTCIRKFSPVLNFQKQLPFAYLKAFCNLPVESFENVYLSWEYSKDGVGWEEYDLISTENISEDSVSKITYSKLDTVYDIDGNLNSDSNVYVNRTGWLFKPNDSLDYVLQRPDLIRIPDWNITQTVDGTLYRVSMFTVKPVKSGDTGYVAGASHTVKTSLGTVVFTPVFSQQTDILENDIPNVTDGNALYNGATLYFFGNPDFKNNLIASNPGETVVPQSRVTPLDITEASYITSIVPWKSYLVCFTEHSVHLVSSVDGGYVASTANTFVGVPAEDSRCGVSTLNGVIFKSDSKVYMIYPNVYAGADSVLNVTCISSPIESYLESYECPAGLTPFAIGTDSYYMLMLPMANSTACIMYDYTYKRWNVHEYPFIALDYEMLNLNDIRITGYVLRDGSKYYGEYVINNDYSAVFSNVPENVPYADILNTIPNLDSWYDLSSSTFAPIPFTLDSGQKSDSLANTKQFVESKFNLATLHQKDSFPMRITVYIDGCPHVITKDVNTDAAFWKESTSHVGTLNTSFITNDSDIFNVFRQMFIRYSGKGKSIRHIIEGESLYPFKIYEIDYRYRNLNTKN